MVVRVRPRFLPSQSPTAIRSQEAGSQRFAEMVFSRREGGGGIGLRNESPPLPVNPTGVILSIGHGVRFDGLESPIVPWYLAYCCSIGGIGRLVTRDSASREASA